MSVAEAKARYWPLSIFLGRQLVVVGNRTCDLCYIIENHTRCVQADVVE